jgi:hypothetical protein
MATLEEFRAQYPQYDDMSDADLTRALHQKFYSDVPFEEFASQVGASGPRPYDPMKSVKNLSSSAYEFGKGMVYPFYDPMGTLQAVGDLGAGALREGARSVLPTSVFNAIEGVDPNPQAAERASQAAGAFKDYEMGRWGSWEKAKRTMENDPVGAFGDVSTVLTGGGTAMTKVGPIAKVGRAVQRAGDFTNPLTPVVGLGKGIAGGAKHVLGMTTGTGSDAIGEAYRAGAEGGKRGRAFTDNLRGKEDPELVIDEAMTGMGNIKDAQRKQYRRDMAVVGADQTPIDTSPIVQTFNDLVEDAYIGGHQKYDDVTMNKLRQIEKALAEWESDPSMHTAIGLDALKQRIDDMMPSLGDKTKNAARVVTTVRNAVKDAIVRQAPEYAEAMRNYEKSASTLDELEKSLSLKPNTSADTTLRKLQSITRNNANTNYGSRGKSAQKLEDAGAETLKARLSGQALNTWMPRGLRGPISALAASGIAGFGSGFTPAAIPFLLAGSPRLVGEAAYLTGKAGKELNRAPRPTRRGLLGLRALGGAGLLGSQQQ